MHDCIAGPIGGQSLSIAKARMTGAYAIPVMLGQGIQNAERIIKGEDYMPAPQRVQRPCSIWTAWSAAGTASGRRQTHRPCCACW